MAVVAPLAVCAALILVRADIDRSTAALVLVLPVVLVAVVGGSGPAALAAVVASLSFDALLTRPYYRLEIHAAEDVEATVILGVVGVVVGQFVARETRSRVRSTARGSELEALVSMVTAAARSADGPQLADRAAAALEEMLDLRECRWAAGYHGEAYPRLAPGGEVSGQGVSPRDRAPLPENGVEVPVVAGGHEFGRLVLVPSGSAPVSREERIVALAIADALAIGLARSVRD